MELPPPDEVKLPKIKKRLTLTGKFEVPVRPHVKERPRFSGKRCFNTSTYEDWKAAARAYAVAAWGKEQILGPVAIDITLYEDRFVVEIEQVEGNCINLRGDVDNLAGGILDALQPKKRKGANGKMQALGGGVIADDKQVVSLFIRKAKIGEA